jgi:hypothetical protein
MTRQERKFSGEIHYRKRGAGLDRGMNIFYPNNITLVKAVVIRRIGEDKRQNVGVNEVLPYGPGIGETVERRPPIGLPIPAVA